MVLPPVETTPILLMRFTDKASPDLVTLVKERLCLGGMIVVTEEQSDDGTCILGLTTSQAELEAEAEQIHMMKKTTDTGSIEYFTVGSERRFSGKEGNSLHERDLDGLFTPNDWALLTGRLLSSMTVLPDGQSSTNLSRMLGIHHSYHGKRRAFVSKRDLFQMEHHQQIKLEVVLLKKKYVDVITPVHIPRCRDKILRETFKLRYGVMPPVDAIGSYYGKQVAFYFAWMGFLTRWLFFPGVLGLVIYLVRIYRGDTIDTDEYTPFYGLVTFVWAVLFIKFWQRHENRLSFWWGTFSLSDYEKQKFFAQRPHFHGVLRKSPVTGDIETYYPAKRRRLQYVVSGSITAVLLGVAFSVMILSLNLQGYIRPKNDPERWNDEHPHPFYYPFLSILAEEGNIFDAASQWRCYLPVVAHSTCILAMNTMYRWVAEWLTEWENHETEQDYQNHLVLKRFLFEAFDCYVALFYLAFYERDVDRLRMELVSVFYIDTFRRLLIECILPMALMHFRGKGHRKDAAKKKKTDQLDKTDYAPLTEEADRDEYEQFDDYMEIVIQLGYVTLFASAYPLASLIAIIANLVEIRADCYKLTHICQRPKPIRAVGLGMWKTLTSCIVWLSALTNCLIFGFTSRQLMQFMPDFYYVDDRDHLRMVPGKGWIIVFIIFGLERVLILSGILVHQIVPDVPEDVAIELERRQHVQFQDRKKARVSSALYRARRRRTSLVVDGIDEHDE